MLSKTDQHKNKKAVLSHDFQTPERIVSGDSPPAKLDVTLDCKVSFDSATIKGHICSFLVSNIIWLTSLSTD